MQGSVKTHFYRDYFALESWCHENNLSIACHNSIRGVITQHADNYPEHPLVAPYIERAAAIQFHSNEELLEKFSHDESVLWLSAAASICGMCQPVKFYESSVNRWAAVAAASVFNSGYSAIRLYKWIKPDLIRQNIGFVEGALSKIGELKRRTSVEELDAPRQDVAVPTRNVAG